MRLRVLSAFSGAGGLDLGLEAAGFENVGCIEIDPLARRTLKRNRPNWLLVDPPDIRELRPKMIPTMLGLPSGSLDLLAGGPPCQPFSTAAQWTDSGKAGWSDERSRTVDTFLDLIQILRPKAVLIENVPGFPKGKTSAIPYLKHFFDDLNERDGISYLWVSRAERKRTSGAEQNRTTERHVVKHQGPGGVRARFRQLPEVGWTSCCA